MTTTMMPSATYESSWVTDDVRMFRESVRQFVHRELVPHQQRWREQQAPDAAAWLAAGEAGLLLPDIPEEYGGGGGTFVHQAVVLEELARAGVHFGAIIQSVVAHYVLAYGTDEQRRSWLPRLARGELVGAIGMTESGAGSDLQSIKTTARREGDQYVINGSKTFITNGRLGTLICLAAKTNPQVPARRGISLVMVESQGLAGYRIGRSLDKVGMHAQDTCELFFDDVRVPAANLLGSEGQGFGQMMERLAYERLAVGVTAVATSEEAVALTARYVKERSAFGKALLDFQHTRFVLAECKTAAHVGRVFLDHCIEQFVAGQLDDTTVAMAKYWLTDSQCRIVDDCLQLHGGYGYMTEYPIARMWADSRVQRIYAGANEIMKELIACSL